MCDKVIVIAVSVCLLACPSHLHLGTYTVSIQESNSNFANRSIFMYGTVTALSLWHIKGQYCIFTQIFLVNSQLQEKLL